MIRLIASDMDGTLLDGQDQLPPGFFGLLSRLRERGIHFVVASGRPYIGVRDIFQDSPVQPDFICDNGAYLVEGGELVAVHTIEREKLLRLLGVLSSLPGVFVSLCGLQGCYVLPSVENLPPEILSFYQKSRIVDDLTKVEDEIFKVSVDDTHAPQNNSYPALQKAFGDELSLQISAGTCMDVMDAGIDKGVALRDLQRRLGITPGETMAFGDYFNDVGMLQSAKYSFAMENGHPDIFPHAAYRAKSNREYGVIQAIEAYVFGPKS